MYDGIQEEKKSGKKREGTEARSGPHVPLPVHVHIFKGIVRRESVRAFFVSKRTPERGENEDENEDEGER